MTTSAIGGYRPTIPLWGLFLIGILDPVVGLAVRSSDLTLGGFEVFLLIPHTLARSALVGAGLAIAIVVVRYLAARTPARLRLEIVVWGAVISAGLIFLSESLTQGGRIGRMAGIEQIRIAIRVGIPVAVFTGLIVLGRLLGGVVRARSRRLPRLLGLVALGATAMAIWINLTVHPGRYLDAHTQLALFAVVTALVAALGLVRHGPLDPVRSRWRVLLPWALALLFLAGGAVVRRTTAFPRVRVLEDRVSSILSEARRFTEPLLDALSPLDDVVADRIIVLPQVDAAAISRALDEALPSRRTLNVIWIALDTVRHDHTGFTPLGPPGSERRYRRHDTTPALDRLARGAFVFRNAYTTYPTSHYAYSSALTGLLPRATPMYRGAFGEPPLPPGSSIAELLRDAGWRTLGLTSFAWNIAHDPKWFGHLAPGFEIYEPSSETGNLSAERTTELALGALGGDDGRPFFAFIHYLAPHAPYPDPENKIVFGDEERDHYDADIRETDSAVGRLLDRLAQRGQLDHTAIFIFSDHGESFGEHGATRHNGNLYEQQIHIPLLIRVPGLEGRIVDAPASVADLMPTTLTLLDIDDPFPRHGRDAFEAMLGETAAHRYAVSEFYALRSGQRPERSRSLVRGGLKLIETDSYPRPVHQLFDLERDPDEARNLFGVPEHAESQGDMIALLRQLYAEAENHTSRVTGVKVASPKEEWRARYRTLVEELLQGKDAAATEAAVELERFLFDAYLALDLAARRHLSEEELLQLRNDVIARVRSTPRARSARRLVRLLAHFEAPDLRPFFRESIAGGLRTLELEAAVGLARLDDDGGRAVLVERYEAGDDADQLRLAPYLARIGDPRGLDVLWLGLTVPGARTVVASLDGLARIAPPELPARLRAPVIWGTWRAPRILEAVLEAVGDRVADEDAQQILVALGRSAQPDLIQGARERLREVMTEARLEGNLTAFDFLKTAQGQLAMSNPGLALESLARASERRDGMVFAEIELALARALTHLGRARDARVVLERLRDQAPGPHDRLRAVALLEDQQSESGSTVALVSVSPAAFAPTRNNPLVRFRLTVENRGPGFAPGRGMPFPPELELELLDGDGRPIEGRTQGRVGYPDPGLRPGERAVVETYLQGGPEPARTLVVCTLTAQPSGHVDRREVGRWQLE